MKADIFCANFWKVICTRTYKIVLQKTRSHKNDKKREFVKFVCENTREQRKITKVPVSCTHIKNIGHSTIETCITNILNYTVGLEM